MKIYLTSIILLIATMLLAAQCGAASAGQNGAPSITVSDPYASAVMAGGNGVIYLKLINEGNSSDVLLSVESQIAEAVEMHETKIDNNDVMRMTPLAKIEVPAGSSISLEPGGKHIMLVNLKQELIPGEKISLILNLEKSGPLAVEAEIRQSSAVTEHSMEHNDEPNDNAEHNH